MKTKLYLLFIVIAVAFAACTGSERKTNVGGKAGEVVVVYDRALWDSTFTKEVGALLAPIYPALPQRERSFDLINIPSASFKNFFQIHRNIIYIYPTVDSVPARMAVNRDVYAQPQTVIRISGPTTTEILEFIERNQERIVHTLEQAERDRFIMTTKRYEERAIRDTVNRIFGGSPFFPGGYAMFKKTDDFVWVGYHIRKAQLGIFIYSFPYKDSTSFFPSNIIAQRNAVLKREVHGQPANSYMTTADIFPPLARNILYNRRHFVEIRGLWEMHNDFMGGPFISHSFLDQTGKNIITLEGFVYHPAGDKRNFLRQVEAIIYSFEWKENQ